MRRRCRKPSLDDETASRSSGRCRRRKGRSSTSAEASCWPTRRRNAASRRPPLAPLAHTIMGKGALPDDHPLVLGMTGFWGTNFINEQYLGADLILGLGTRFSEADCSSWEEAYTFSFPPPAHPHRRRPGRDRTQFPGGARRGRRSEAGVARAQPRGAELAPKGVQRPECGPNRGQPEAFVAGNRKAATSDAYPMRPERILADVREVLPRDALCTTWAGTRTASASSFRFWSRAASSLRAATRRWASARRRRWARRSPVRSGRRRAGGRRRLRPEPGGARHGVRRGHRGRVGHHEQLRVRHHRGPREGAFRHDVRHRFEKNGKPWSPDYAAIARAYGVDGVRIGAAAEFRPALRRRSSRSARRPRRRHEERAGADRGTLEHHGHLLAGQEGAPREHRQLTPTRRRGIVAAEGGRAHRPDRIARHRRAAPTQRNRTA